MDELSLLLAVHQQADAKTRRFIEKIAPYLFEAARACPGCGGPAEQCEELGRAMGFGCGETPSQTS